MSDSAQFDKAVSIVQSLPKEGPIKPSDDDKLVFYKYYKQATVGKVNTVKPGMFDFVGKAKWDAWKGVEDVSQEVARQKYVEKLLEILNTADTEESKKFIAEISPA